MIQIQFSFFEFSKKKSRFNILGQKLQVLNSVKLKFFIVCWLLILYLFKNYFESSTLSKLLCLRRHINCLSKCLVSGEENFFPCKWIVVFFKKIGNNGFFANMRFWILQIMLIGLIDLVAPIVHLLERYVHK